jgi:hypothetical protein
MPGVVAVVALESTWNSDDRRVHLTAVVAVLRSSPLSRAVPGAD